ncbi:MAG: histidine kinase dimerization/phospho-acceptor domain-containing protein [Erythrobacter sp.]|jgi:signal transduction histidine kinase|nr:histidine kinase dimerization/phospho-acceptor domain-containing protein [Erythrobacter sp.]
MFIDDRLATVLRQPGTGEAARRTQFRQLLDILGNRKFGPDNSRSNSLVASAWLRMDALAKAIPAAERAAIIREPSWRFRSADLAAHLADFEPEVAAAALQRAQLSAEDWSALIPRLPIRARGFLRLRGDLPDEAVWLLDRLGVRDRGLPAPGAAPTDHEPSALPLDAYEVSEGLIEAEQDAGLLSSVPAASGVASHEPEFSVPDPIETGRSEISALVERIAQFRRTREAPSLDAERSPRLPLGEEHLLRDTRANAFGFAADAGGRIEWADPAVAAMVIGTRLVTPPTLGDRGERSELERAFAHRQPIRGARIELRGAAAIAGEWIVDAQPSFTDDGSFTSYIGRFRRMPDPAGEETGRQAREADRIRQLLHELRTPITAVQGYAEVIQQEIFGHAPHEYRALAANIAADAARILAGFEELDRLARLEIGLATVSAGETDLPAVVRRTLGQLAQVLGPRMAGIELAVDADEPIIAALDHDEAELMIWRLLATLGGGCAAGEILHARLSSGPAEARLAVELPAQLLGVDDVFTAEAKPVGSAINAGLFGAGFALRLARAEARAVTGDLTTTEEGLLLRLPLASAMALTARGEANSA